MAEFVYKIQLGDRQGVASALNVLGIVALLGREYEEGKRYLEESLAICRELGLGYLASCLNNLGHVHVRLGEDDKAWGYLREALNESVAVGAAHVTLEALVGVAGLRAKAGRYVRAAELAGLVLGHSALSEETKQFVDPLLATLREALSADELEAALERGESLVLEEVVAEVLGKVVT